MYLPKNPLQGAPGGGIPTGATGAQGITLPQAPIGPMGAGGPTAPIAPIGGPSFGGPMSGPMAPVAPLVGGTSINVPHGSKHEVIWTNEGENDAIIAIDIDSYGKEYEPRTGREYVPRPYEHLPGTMSGDELGTRTVDRED